MKRIVFLTLLAFSSIISAQNIVDTSTWTEGFGEITNFKTMGSIENNSREMAAGPHGKQVLVWRTDARADIRNDGGFDMDFVPIDHTRTYRFSIW